MKGPGWGISDAVLFSLLSLRDASASSRTFLSSEMFGLPPQKGKTIENRN